MARKVELAPQATSPAGRADFTGGQNGFTLLEVICVLAIDHHAAQRQRKEIATVVEAPLRTIRSGASSRVVRLPADVNLDAVLATRCNNRPAGPTIRHLPSGMSCGGSVALTRQGIGYQVRVNWLTGGVEVVPIN